MIDFLLGKFFYPWLFFFYSSQSPVVGLGEIEVKVRKKRDNNVKVQTKEAQGGHIIKKSIVGGIWRSESIGVYVTTVMQIARWNLMVNFSVEILATKHARLLGMRNEIFEVKWQETLLKCRGKNLLVIFLCQCRCSSYKMELVKMATYLESLDYVSWRKMALQRLCSSPLMLSFYRRTQVWSLPWLASPWFGQSISVRFGFCSNWWIFLRCKRDLSKLIRGFL